MLASQTVDSAEAEQRLSEVLGQPLTFAMESDVSHFDDGPVSVVGLGSIRALATARGEKVDPGRFRANLIIDDAEPFAEDRWIGHSVSIGTAVLRITMASPRCVMVDMETFDLPAQPGNLAAIGELNHARLGVLASVTVPGTITKGDTLAVLG